METPKTDPANSANDSEMADDVTLDKGENKNTGRRLQDSITSKDPHMKLNLDRRVKNSDRRFDSDPNYKGPSRRYTIDRRLNLKDRRKKD